MPGSKQKAARGELAASCRRVLRPHDRSEGNKHRQHSQESSSPFHETILAAHGGLVLKTGIKIV
jgi:hypothetical protein